jgi:Protein of unknown function (DUF1460)
MFRLHTVIFGSLVALGLSGLPAIAAPVSPLLSPADQLRLNQTLRIAKQDQLATKPFGMVVQAIARQYIGATYQAGLLDQSPTEQLFISLQRFDCVLFIESMLALARTVVANSRSPSTFAHQVKVQRYRDGDQQTYCGRLHYFSDWISDNERRGLVRNVTLALGGVPLRKPLNFMTQHRSSYPQLQRSEPEFICLKAAEASLALKTRYYIPTAKIGGIYPKLQAGDIVAIATAVPGLDVTHTGFLERQPNGGVGLIHASPVGAVARASDLQTYASRVPEAIGIIVARPNAAAPADRNGSFTEY